MVGVDFLLFTDGVFAPHALADPRAINVLDAATDRVRDQVQTSDLLHAIIESGDAGVESAISPALAEGAGLQDVLNGIAAYNPGGGTGIDGRRERFTTSALDALDKFAADLATYAERQREVGLELLAACVLEHLDPQDRRYLLPILDADRAARALRTQVRTAVQPLPALLDETTGRLRSEEFSEASWAALELATERAADLGYDRILQPHCLLGLLGETEGAAEHLIRLQISPAVGLAKVSASVTDAFRISDRRRDATMALDREAIGEALLNLLQRAQRTAAVWEAERIDTLHLLGALLDTMPPRLSHVLQAAPLNLDLPRLREHLNQALRDARTSPPREVAFRLPSGLPPTEDLTWLARTEELPAALHLDHYFDPLTRALHRTTANHVLVTGPPGVGTTTLLRELARRAAAGQIPFLRRKRFLLVDCRDVAAADSGATLAGIIAQVADRTDLITCIDGLGSLLRDGSGGDHRLTLRSALRDRRIHLIGVLGGHEFDDMIVPDHSLVELITRVDMDEPSQVEARDMVRQAADALAAEFDLAVDERAIERAVVLAGDYIINERLPAKAIRVLRRACEDLHYRRTQEASEQAAVGGDDIVSVVSEISGVPASQISGRGGERIDLEHTLGETIVGQPDAVRTVAAELRRIKAGLAGSRGRPASVLFFAGLTGVGKTELAKTIARVYSASKRLQTYPMENFTESHSVSGIIGSPPGFVGYEQGGRLINDLNTDPYCVFLLDEAEKAHPDVWRPFLNLFDEGWIVDQRGVKAFADRAFFILTSNAGHDIIARMSREGRSGEDISKAVEEHLRSLSHERSGRPLFPPEFLARIRQIIVFRPLDYEAIAGICRHKLDEQRSFWRERREKELIIPETLVERIVARGHALAAVRGGRAVEAVVTELVENPLTKAAERQTDEYERCSRIELISRPGSEEVEVRFRAEGHTA